MSDGGFPRSARLLCAADFKGVFDASKRSADRYFTVLAHRTAHRAGSTARLGLAISKKQARRAIDRNRLKRLAREVFRHQRSRLAGLDLVVMARRAALDASNEELCVALDHHFVRLSEALAGES